MTASVLIDDPRVVQRGWPSRGDHPFRTMPASRWFRSIAPVSIRVVIADDNLIAREGIQQILATEPDLEVVASVGDLPELLDAVDRVRPDVVLTDIRMPPTLSDEGLRFANRLRDTHPDV